MAKGTVTIVGVGDVMVNRPKPESIFAFSADTLRQADIAFCQSETSYSDKGSPGSSGPRGAIPHDLRNYPALASVGLDVISMASNHTSDWGRDSLIDGIERMRRDGMNPVGAGRNIDEAREPVILERNGTRIAFLAYCSVAPKGYYAAQGKFGVAPMRAYTHYEPFEEDQPGTPCEIMTIPVPEDLEALIEDVKRVRSKADVVIVSLHWGIHFFRAVIAQYQPVVAHAVIDAGADLILGHHPHILKGIEVYKGKVIFYSLGNFAMDSASFRGHDLAPEPSHRAKMLRVYGMGENALLHGEGLKTMIAKVAVADKRIQRVSFIPGLINDDHQPEPLSPGDPRGQEVIQYMREITQEANLNGTYRVEGDEVVISG